ncbi:MAG: hypothetical protein ACRCUF_04710 [Aeromonas sobria]
MKLKEILLTILITSSIIGLAHWSAERSVAAKAEQLEQAAQRGKDWMRDTTAKLDTIQVGIEQITGETVELAQRIDNLATRVTTLEVTQ